MTDAELPSYNEPVKRKVRTAVLEHAVKLLTRRRYESPLVTEDFFLSMYSYADEYARKHTKLNLRKDTKESVDLWLQVHRSFVSNRKPEDLKVLILSGPNPRNDFGALVKLGISPFHIWAIEGDKACYERAIAEFKENHIPLRLHHGSLQEFFAVVPQQFDIVYFDACGPLFGGKPNTIPVIRELFINQRLTPLSVLITNFANATVDKDNDEKWARRMACWYAARYEQPVNDDGEPSIRFSEFQANADEDRYVDHIKRNLGKYYSHFISSFISQFAAEMVPWLRTAALPAARRELFSQDKQRKQAQSRIKHVPEKVDYSADKPWLEFGHAILGHEGYPLLWAAEFAKSLEPGDPLRNLCHDTKILEMKLAEAMTIWPMIRNYFESMVGWAEENHQVCSDDFANALRKFPWFDVVGFRGRHLFCDTPLPNLIADAYVGQLGYPFHTNLKQMARYAYTAKRTEMFTDVFVLDQARYLYDFLPSVALTANGLGLDFQLIIRICMDGIWRNSFGLSDVFWGSALACDGEGFTVAKVPKRKKPRS